MKTVIHQIEEIQLIAREGWIPECNIIDNFSNACGAGKGFQEKVIPDSILRCRIAAACHIHDDMFDNGAPTWSDFHQANSILFHNVFEILRCRSVIGMRFIRILIAATYFEAVDTLGALAYKSVKHSQGYRMS